MDRLIKPAKNIVGGLSMPGDKGISHRYAMLGAIAEGETTIRNFAPGEDCASTLRCLKGLGVEITRRTVQNGSGSASSGVGFVEEVVIQGRCLRGFRTPESELDAGNSGSTMRMLSGLLAGQTFSSEITGDESLRRRPMRRIMEPLRQMGAGITARDGDLPPLVIQGSPLRGISYQLPVPSAQVKSAILLAGLLAEGETTVEEPVSTRDHTEIALETFGADISRGRRKATVKGGHALAAQKLEIPGDISSAAFFICAALLFPESNLMLQGVGVNPTRTALFDLLNGMGAKIKVLNLGQSSSGELIGDIHVSRGRANGSRTDDAMPRGGRIDGAMTAGLIDEIPVLAVLATQTEKGLILRDAKELRIKETDRIATVAENLQRMGARVTIHLDGMDIPGRQQLHGAEIDSFGDHRIAMAFAVAALAAEGESVIRESESASVSFPGFYEQLDRIIER